MQKKKKKPAIHTRKQPKHFSKTTKLSKGPSIIIWLTGGSVCDRLR